jgi:hypothetical protein
VGVEGVKETIKPPKLPGMYENSAKNGLFPTITGLKIAKNAFFTQKVS